MRACMLLSACFVLVVPLHSLDCPCQITCLIYVWLQPLVSFSTSILASLRILFAGTFLTTLLEVVSLKLCNYTGPVKRCRRHALSDQRFSKEFIVRNQSLKRINAKATLYTILCMSIKDGRSEMGSYDAGSLLPNNVNLRCMLGLVGKTRYCSSKQTYLTFHLFSFILLPLSSLLSKRCTLEKSPIPQLILHSNFLHAIEVSPPLQVNTSRAS